MVGGLTRGDVRLCRSVAKEHLGQRVASLSSARLNQICAALGFALGCDPH